jgi:putative acetyltransferase
MRIRIEAPADRDAVRDVVNRAFGREEGVGTLVDALRVDDPEVLSLVAEVAGAVVGHVMFSRSLLDAPRRLVPVQVLSPLAVRPDHQRQGVGGALVTAGVQMLAARGESLVFLEGSPVYYRRLGFVAGDDLGFRKPSLRIPDKAFQVMPLPAYETWMTGTLVYSQTFWNHDAVGLRDD